MPKRSGRPTLTVQQILAWADAHHERTGQWPLQRSGPVTDAPGETWSAIDVALRRGHRGLPEGSSLSWLLAHQGRDGNSFPTAGTKERTYRPRERRPPGTLLTVEQILVWADAHHTRTGRWPHQRSGAVAGVPGQSWSGVDEVLRSGLRGLPGGDTLAQLLNRHRRGGRIGRPGPVPRDWTAEEVEMVRTLPAKAVARRTGCSLTAVYRRRHQLEVGGR
jgi:hypothetical protein